MKYLKYLIALTLSFFLNVSFASDDHDHDKKDEKKSTAKSSQEDDHSKEGEHKDEKEEAHGDEHGEHKEGEEHGEESEENAQVGKDKGILEANKEKGFKLSPEAEKNFSVIKVKVVSAISIEIPKSAVVTSAMEVNLYRLRDGFYKRIDFKIKSTNSTSMTISSDELTANDEIATTGLGFLRISELAAFDGAPAGHSH